MKSIITLIFLVIITAVFDPVQAKEPQDKPMPESAQIKDNEIVNGKTPTVITSDKLRIDTQKKIGLFTGNVFVNNEQFTMTSDEMRVFFNDEKNGVDEIVATGNVVLKQVGADESVARGEQAVFTTSKDDGKGGKITDDVIVLTGNPTIQQGDNTISGKVIRFFKSQNKMIVEGGSRLILYENQDGKPGLGITP